MSQTGIFHVHTHHEIRQPSGMYGTYFQIRNASDSSNHEVKIVDLLVCGVHTGRKNPRRRNIVEILFLGQVGNRLKFKLECNSPQFDFY